jgi:hypothetical protein
MFSNYNAKILILLGISTALCVNSLEYKSVIKPEHGDEISICYITLHFLTLTTRAFSFYDDLFANFAPAIPTSNDPIAQAATNKALTLAKITRGFRRPASKG